MPGNNVQRPMTDFSHIEPTTPFDMYSARRFLVFKGGMRRLEIAGVGQAIRADRASVRQGEFGTVILANISARFGTIGGHGNLEDHAARYDAKFKRGHFHAAKFGENLNRSGLRHDHHLTVGIEKIIVDHIGVEDIGMGGHSCLGGRIAGRRHGANAVQEVGAGLRSGQRVPAKLAQSLIFMTGRRFPMRALHGKKPFGVPDTGPNSIEPGPFVRAAWCGKRRAGQLFGVQAVIALLGAVLALGQCAGQAFGLKIVSEAGHVVQNIAAS